MYNWGEWPLKGIYTVLPVLYSNTCISEIKIIDKKSSVNSNNKAFIVQNVVNKMIFMRVFSFYILWYYAI